METKREILITNDDSVYSKGVRYLAEMMRFWGNVTVVAPSKPQSGKSASLTLGVPAYLEKICEEDGLRIYAFDGTPADCVKLALNIFFTDRKPDLLVSGINHGSNASVASLYSGTLGACIEATINGIPSVGFSICSHNEETDLSVVKEYGTIILNKYFQQPPSCGVYLNVNFPKLKPEEVKGIRMAKRGLGRWIKEYETGVDENGKMYYIMKGCFVDDETAQDSIGDHVLLLQRYVTIVPHKIDITDYEEIEALRKSWDIE